MRERMSEHRRAFLEVDSQLASLLDSIAPDCICPFLVVTSAMSQKGQHLSFHFVGPPHAISTATTDAAPHLPVFALVVLD